VFVIKVVTYTVSEILRQKLQKSPFSQFRLMPKLGLIPYKLLCEIIGLNKLEFPSYPVMKATSSDVYLSGLTSNL